MKALITIIILALLAWGGYALFHTDSPEGYTQTTNDATGSDYTPSTDSTASSTTNTTTSVKEFTVVGKNYSFSPATMTVKKGDTVRITFQNSAGTHDWRLDEFNAKTGILQSNQSQTIEFVADKTGSFEYYCSIGTHRQMGMKGTLTVI